CERRVPALLQREGLNGLVVRGGAAARIACFDPEHRGVPLDRKADIKVEPARERGDIVVQHLEVRSTRALQAHAIASCARRGVPGRVDPHAYDAIEECRPERARCARGPARTTGVAWTTWTSEGTVAAASAAIEHHRHSKREQGAAGES